MLIAFEGIDCVGKTMAIKMIEKILADKGYLVTTESDWKSSYTQELKDIVIHNRDQLSQLFAVLIARRYMNSPLQARLKEFDVVLQDRYSLSTLVYQDVLTLHPELLPHVEECTLPHELFYIRPTPEYDRKGFLDKRDNRNRIDDSWKQGEWLKMYEFILAGHRQIADNTKARKVLQWEYVYKVDNDGTDKFAERITHMADKIAERIDAEKRMKQEHEL